jgi:hypothetical protein
MFTGGSIDETTTSPAPMDRSGPLLVDMGRCRIEVAGKGPQEIRLTLVCSLTANCQHRLAFH